MGGNSVCVVEASQMFGCRGWISILPAPYDPHRLALGRLARTIVRSLVRFVPGES